MRQRAVGASNLRTPGIDESSDIYIFVYVFSSVKELRKITKYLAKHKISMLLIVLFLVIEAIFDLSLPQYTADIVDVGIQQGGIEHAAPEVIRESSFDTLSLFMTSDETALLEKYYDLHDADDIGDIDILTDDSSVNEPLYVLNESGSEHMDDIDELVSLPMVITTYAGESDEMQQAVSQLSAMKAAGADTDEMITSMREQIMEKYDTMSDSIISQAALSYVQAEYKAIGVDTDAIQTSYLWRTGGIMLLYSVIIMLCAILVSYFASRAGAAIGRDLRNSVFKKVVSFSNVETIRFSTASLITRCTNDIQQVQMVCVLIMRIILYAPILAIGGIIKVVNTHTGMSWIIVVAVVAVSCVVAILMSVTLPKFRIMQTLVDKLNLVSREILSGIPVIRAFSREKHEEARFRDANENLMKTQLFTNRAMSFMMPSMMFIMNAVSVLIVWKGAHGVELGNLQVGDMIAFITYTMIIVASFLMITIIAILLPRAGVAAERIEEVINTEPAITDKPEEMLRDGELDDIEGRITFENVSFRYPDAEKDSISDISFTAEPGATTAIIGSTGSGKSTLMNLILRFYDVSEGRILIDGIDIRDISQKKLRSLTGYVPQKGFLFSGTIESNLKFGGEYIDDESVKEAVEISQSADFISEKPDGLKSHVAQEGSNVSGGQRQRLSIARAIARKAKILLFDDSFSALDFKTDAALRHALEENTSGITRIIVAQRISTIMYADKIIVMNEGRIVGTGTHEELMNSCTEYREIAESQLSAKDIEMKGGLA